MRSRNEAMKIITRAMGALDDEELSDLAGEFEHVARAVDAGDGEHRPKLRLVRGDYMTQDMRPRENKN